MALDSDDSEEEDEDEDEDDEEDKDDEDSQDGNSKLICSQWLAPPFSRQALHAHEFPTPTPIDQNRHCIVMSMVNARPFGQVRSVRSNPP